MAISPGTTASGLPSLIVTTSPVQIGRNASHVVVDGRQHRDRLARHVDTREDLCGLADAGQTLMQNFRTKVLQVELNVILLRAAATGGENAQQSIPSLE